MNGFVVRGNARGSSENAEVHAEKRRTLLRLGDGMSPFASHANILNAKHAGTNIAAVQCIKMRLVGWMANGIARNARQQPGNNIYSQGAPLQHRAKADTNGGLL